MRFCFLSQICSHHLNMLHVWIKKFPSGGGGRPDNILLVINILRRECTDLPREAIGPRGSNCFQLLLEWSRDQETNSHLGFFWGGGSGPPVTPLDPTICLYGCLVGL